MKTAKKVLLTGATAAIMALPMKGKAQENNSSDFDRKKAQTAAVVDTIWLGVNEVKNVSSIKEKPLQINSTYDASRDLTVDLVNTSEWDEHWTARHMEQVGKKGRFKLVLPELIIKESNGSFTYNTDKIYDKYLPILLKFTPQEFINNSKKAPVNMIIDFMGPYTYIKGIIYETPESSYARYTVIIDSQTNDCILASSEQFTIMGDYYGTENDFRILDNNTGVITHIPKDPSVFKNSNVFTSLKQLNEALGQDGYKQKEEVKTPSNKTQQEIIKEVKRRKSR